jgi:hypothetical protein
MTRSSPFSLFGLALRAGGFALACAAAAGCSLALSSGGSAGAGGSGSTNASTGTMPGAGGSGGELIAATSATSGAGGGTSGVPPYFNGSYSYLCGGSAPLCTPGTGDCTQGGNPQMTGTSSGTGGTALACQLAPVDGEAVPGCVPVGMFNAGDPCESAAHCGADLGCIATMSGGICRPYCCGDLEACPTNTFCAPVAMAEAAVKIPVCIPATKCKPLDDTSCPMGQTCTIVRDDGTTSCVDAGFGMRGGSCPCAPGHVCSKITNKCLKLCHIGNDAADCGMGACQGGVMGYPDGIGICVGYP